MGVKINHKMSLNQAQNEKKPILLIHVVHKIISFKKHMCTLSFLSLVDPFMS